MCPVPIVAPWWRPTQGRPHAARAAIPTRSRGNPCRPGRDASCAKPGPFAAVGSTRPRRHYMIEGSHPCQGVARDGISTFGSPTSTPGDNALIDAMKALHPSWDRAYLQMQLFGAEAQAMSMATSIANGHDARGGREPPGAIIAVAGVALHPEANWLDGCYVAAIDLTHASGRTRRVEVGSHLRLADGWSLVDEAVVGLRVGPWPGPARGPGCPSAALPSENRACRTPGRSTAPPSRRRQVPRRSHDTSRPAHLSRTGRRGRPRWKAR